MARFEFTPAVTGFPRLAKDWDRLNDKLNQQHPLLAADFVGPLIAHFGQDRDVLGTAVDAAGSLTSALLLRPGSAGRWTSFLPSQAQVAPLLLAPDFHLKDVLAHLPGTALSVELRCQDGLVSPLMPPRAAPGRENTPHLTTTAVDLSSGFESYWSSRSKNLRKNLKRYRQRAEDDRVALELQVIEDAAGIRAALDRYGDLESKGWKGARGTAIHASNVQGRFYGDVLARFAEHGGAHVYELRSGDTLLASRLCISRGGMIVVLKTTYDESRADYAPGRVLLQSLLEREFGQGRFRTVEFYTNANHDSITWATTTRDIGHVTQYRWPWLLNAVAGLRAVARIKGRITGNQAGQGTPPAAGGRGASGAAQPAEEPS